MTARDYGWVTLPSLAVLAAAPVAEFATGGRHLMSATAAVLLTWPMALFSLWWVGSRTDRRMVAIVVIAAGLLRQVVAVAGSVLVYFAADWTKAAGWTYWLWIAVAYLSSLAAEVFVLAKPGWVGRGGGGRKG